MKQSKNQKRREKLKQRKANGNKNKLNSASTATTQNGLSSAENSAIPVSSSEILLARKYEWIQPSNPLFSMHKQLTERLNSRLNDSSYVLGSNIDVPSKAKRRHSESEPDQNEAQNTQNTLNTDSTGTVDPGESKDSIESSKPSKRSVPNKPSLSYLKSITTHPELVQWYDCDADDPEYTVFMKTQPHVVQPPDTWRARSEIPRFSVRKAYTLPASVVNTGIAAACTACGPIGIQQGKLDVDYEKMHTALHSTRSAPFLSSLGEIPSLKGFTERRAVVKHKKTVPSKRLCEALGVPLGTEPWAAAVAKHGQAPGFGRNTEYKQWGAFLVDS